MKGYYHKHYCHNPYIDNISLDDNSSIPKKYKIWMYFIIVTYVGSTKTCKCIARTLQGTLAPHRGVPNEGGVQGSYRGRN